MKFGFICSPSSPDSKQHLLKTNNRIITNFNAAGVHLLNHMFGYKEKMTVYFLEISFEKESSLYQRWTCYVSMKTWDDANGLNRNIGGTTVPTRMGTYYNFTNVAPKIGPTVRNYCRRCALQQISFHNKIVFIIINFNQTTPYLIITLKSWNRFNIFCVFSAFNFIFLKNFVCCVNKLKPYFYYF